MMLIRRFEERAERLGSRGAIPGGIHSAAGQEAVAVGTMRALRPDDDVAGTHRSHHPRSPRASPAPQRDGRAVRQARPARCGGRGGTMHLADLDRGYLGGNGIVGAGVGIAMGAALACQLKGDAAWRSASSATAASTSGAPGRPRTSPRSGTLPLIIVCENNMYAVETRFDLVLGGGSAVRRAEGFGLNAVSVDGQDVAAVYRAVHAAAERARAGGGASFVEARTYRYEGHNTGQIITYRTDDEVADWRLRDPINRFSAALAAAGDRSARATSSGIDRRATSADRRGGRVRRVLAASPTSGHGAGQRHLHADRVLGVPMSETMTYAAAFQRAMGDEMERDETIFVLGTDLYVRGGHFAQVKGLGERFGHARVRDTPISEAAMVAAGVGSAMHGMRPVVDLNFADFAMGAMDEIVNQAAKMRYMFGAKVPLVIRGSARRRAVRGPAHEQRRVLVRGHAGPGRGDAGDARRRRRAARARRCAATIR